MSTGTTQTMKAIQVHTFGGPEVLVYEDVPRPQAAPGEVLIRVHAAGVNNEWHPRAGFPGVPEQRRPKIHLPWIPGSDVSGVVEAVGPDVTTFHQGDAVYGLIRFPASVLAGLGTYGGTYAEYTTANVSDLAPKPTTIDHFQAAAVPLAALTAWQALFEHAKLEAGQTVLVNGAAGGVGHFAVQLAKVKGAQVIGVAAGRHEAFLRELGVDHFIDYTATPVEEAGRVVDLVLDTVNTLSSQNGDRLLDVLKRGGSLVSVAGQHSAERAAGAGVTLEGHWFVHSSGAQLVEIGGLIDVGRVRVAIETVVPLAEAYKAHERGERGHVRGKMVLRVVEEGRSSVRVPHTAWLS